MKKIAVAAVVLSGMAFSYNMRAPHADMAVVNPIAQVSTEKGSAYLLDVNSSTVAWIGSKPSGKHNGSISFEKGTMEVKKGKIVSGSFGLNMASIADLDMQGRGKEGLEKHLKSADFFDVEKFPTATFEITEVKDAPVEGNLIMVDASYIISGNLTMKGVTQNISIPARINVDGETLTASSTFNIDRTLWGINYGSDGKVAKEINLTLNITAKQ